MSGIRDLKISKSGKAIVSRDQFVELAKDEEVEFSFLIRAARELLGLTNNGLAKELATSASTVSFWAEGKHTPSSLKMERLRELLVEKIKMIKDYIEVDL